MFVIVLKNIVPKGYKAITFFPFIFLVHSKDKKDKVLINHEKIHIYQQIELGIIIFYIWYVVEFCIRLLHYKNKYLAYKNISFEREAYSQESDENYLSTRKLWNFWRFL